MNLDTFDTSSVYPRKPGLVGQTLRLTRFSTRCLIFPPQCLIPFLRYFSFGSSFMLVLLPSHPCSPNICLNGERERLVGLGAGMDASSSSMSSKVLTGDGVRVTVRPREKEDEASVSSLDLVRSSPAAHANVLPTRRL